MVSKQMSLMFDTEMLDRADKLVDFVESTFPVETRMTMKGRITRSTVLRLAVLRGLEALEAEQNKTKASKKSSR